MASPRRAQFFLLLSCLSGAISCAPTNIPSIGAGEKAFQPEEDEKQLWETGKEIEQRIAKAGILYEDRDLETYLNKIAQKLLARELEGVGVAPTVKVIRDPFLNAFALPHGAIYFHTGMLARIENEAQLATVLGHELAHFIHRHSVKEMRSLENRLDLIRLLQALLVAGASAYGAGAAVGALTGSVGELWALASINGYSKELETEADTEGLRLMVQAGYEPGESVKAFQLLIQEREEKKLQEPFFYSSHPRVEERIENHSRLLQTQYQTAAKEKSRLRNMEDYSNRIQQLLLDNAALDIEIGHLKTARATIDRHLPGQPESARAHFLLGEIHRRSRGDESSARQAIASYQEAGKLDPSYAEPHRELGLLYREQNRRDEALVEFERYLVLSPKAVDAAIIRGYIAELRKP